MTRFWHRRFCEAGFLVSLVILSLYAWAYLSETPAMQAALLIEMPVAILAGVTMLVSLAFYIWPPKEPGWASLTVYLLLILMTGWLVVSSGGVTSPFIALWILVLIFSAVFGWQGVAPVLTGVIVYIAISIVIKDAPTNDLVIVVFSGIVPLILSFIIWHNREDSEMRHTNLEKPQISELNKVTNQSEIVINAIGDGVLAIDSMGVIQLINPAAQEIIGWDQGDAVSLNYKSVLTLTTEKGEELGMAGDPINQALNTNQEHRTSDIGLTTNSGKKILISMVVSPIGDPGAGVIVILRDITKEKAEESQQTAFISTASHEMRTPVASIEGYLGLALNPATAQIDDKARDFISKAHESTQHLGNLLRDLLDITKADDGRLNSKPQLIDMVQFTQGVSDGLRARAAEKGLQYVYKPSDSASNDKQLNPVFYVNIDKDHLREVLDNLIENAIKYTLTGQVVIDVSGDVDNVIFSVKDSGIGIPAEDIPHLFQKFYRVDNSDTREIGGTGLGLYLCRRLVESMNGRLWVESKYKEGSTFFVALPRLTRDEVSRLQDEMSRQPQVVAQPPVIEPYIPETPQQAPVQIEPQSQPIAQPEPAPVYYAPPQPVAAPLPVQIQYQQPQPEPIAQPQYTAQPQSANTPLSAIESNPEQYRYAGPTTPRARSIPVVNRDNQPS